MGLGLLFGWWLVGWLVGNCPDVQAQQAASSAWRKLGQGQRLRSNLKTIKFFSAAAMHRGKLKPGIIQTRV